MNPQNIRIILNRFLLVPHNMIHNFKHLYFNNIQNEGKKEIYY